MFKTKLGSNIFDRRCAALRLESILQRADRTRLAAVGEQRTANRAGPSAFRCHGPLATLSVGFIVVPLPTFTP